MARKRHVNVIAEDNARERDIALRPARASGGPFVLRRCKSVYPGVVTLASGKPIRCEEAEGHTGRHGHSFAARYWE